MLLGYGSDRWWRVQVIAMFVATGAIVVLGAYQYVHAPVRVEISVVDVSLSPGPSPELRTDLAFSSAGSQGVVVSDVSLCLARHNPPRCFVVPGHLEGEATRGGFLLPSGGRERRVFEFASAHGSVSEGLDIHEAGRFLVEASLRVTVVDRLGRERLIPVEGMTAVVDGGTVRSVESGDVVARYVGR